MALLLGGLALALRHHLALTPDSWTYYELARSIPGDFYRLHLVRQFQFVSPYGASFPPLWPLLVRLADGLTGAGVASGFWLAVLASGLFVALSEAAGRRCFDSRWVGLGAALIALTHHGLLQEVAGGRTMPLQMCLYAAILWSIAGTPGPGKAALAGLLGGLAVMNRFDALPAALVLAAAMPLLGQPRWRAGAAGLAGLLLALSPWLLYSRRHFGRWFVSDNSGTALNPDPQAHVTDWWPHARPTLFDAPGAWLAKVLANALRLFPEMLFSPGPATLLCWLSGAGLIVLLYQRLKAAPAPSPRVSPPLRRGPLVGFSLAVLALLPGYALTGYFDARYFVPQFWLAAFLLLGWAARRIEPGERRERFGAGVGVIALAAAALLLATGGRPERQDAQPGPALAARDAQLARCLAASPGAGAILAADPLEGSRWSALYGWDVVLLPRNFARLTMPERGTFLARYRISHVYWPAGDPEQDPKQDPRRLLPLVPLAGCPTTLLGISRGGAGPGG